MSLGTKLMLSIVIFMVLVLGLLTVTLWLDLSVRAREETERNARLVADLMASWLGDQIGPTGRNVGGDWQELHKRLQRSPLVSDWLIVGVREYPHLEGHPERSSGRYEVLSSQRPVLEDLSEGDRAAFDEILLEPKVLIRGTYAYARLQSVHGAAAVRFELRGKATPSYDMSQVLLSILWVMGLGTALLLLNSYMFVRRFVLRPFRTLMDGSKRVAAGDFTKPIPSPRTFDEVETLVETFNWMMSRMAEYHRVFREDIEKARAKIGQTEKRLFAAQRLSTTGTLAAGIAHEINNPLGGMINAARELQSGRLDESKRREYEALIGDGLERIRGIVQKILRFSPKDLEPRWVFIGEFVDKAVAFLQHRIRKKDVTLDVALPDDMPPIRGDALELQQAFLNVLINAVDAVAVGEGRIWIDAKRRDTVVEIAVRDNGCGMTEEERSRCMDLFFTTKDVGEGTTVFLTLPVGPIHPATPALG